MLGFNEIPFAVSALRVCSPEPREPRVALHFHWQCAWCLRLKHRDGTPHGHPWPRLSFYSSGICAPCKAKLEHRDARGDDTRTSARLDSPAPVPAAA